MTLKEIQQRNYAATERRGFIKPETKNSEFIAKLLEEFRELDFEVDNPFFDDKTKIAEEIADVIIVVLNFAKHIGIDIQTALEQKTIYNENRND